MIETRGVIEKLLEQLHGLWSCWKTGWTVESGSFSCTGQICRGMTCFFKISWGHSVLEDVRGVQCGCTELRLLLSGHEHWAPGIESAGWKEILKRESLHFCKRVWRFYDQNVSACLESWEQGERQQGKPDQKVFCHKLLNVLLLSGFPASME